MSIPERKDRICTWTECIEPAQPKTVNSQATTLDGKVTGSGSFQSTYCAEHHSRIESLLSEAALSTVLPNDVAERIAQFPKEYQTTAGKPMREFFEEAAMLGYLAGRRETLQSKDAIRLAQALDAIERIAANDTCGCPEMGAIIAECQIAEQDTKGAAQPSVREDLAREAPALAAEVEAEVDRLEGDEGDAVDAVESNE